MEIIDELELKQTGKKIELVYCLQENYNKNSVPHFYKSKYTLDLTASKIKRVAKSPGGEYDLILVTAKGGFTNIFLGHWNDGVVN